MPERDSSEHVAARFAIAELFAAYAAATDRADFAAFPALLTGDVRLRLGAAGNWIEGADEVIARIRQAWESVAWQKHLITVTGVRFTGATAEVGADLVVHQRNDGPPARLTTRIGEYECLARHSADGWRLAELSLSIGHSDTRDLV